MGLVIAIRQHLCIGRYFLNEHSYVRNRISGNFDPKFFTKDLHIQAYTFSSIDIMCPYSALKITSHSSPENHFAFFSGKSLWIRSSLPLLRIIHLTSSFLSSCTPDSPGVQRRPCRLGIAIWIMFLLEAMSIELVPSSHTIDHVIASHDFRAHRRAYIPP